MVKGEEKEDSNTRRVRWILWFCGLYVTQLGAIMTAALFASFLYPETLLVALLGKLRVPLGPLAGNSWVQVAIALGMHGYADLSTGFAMMSLVTKDSNKCALPAPCATWNVIKFQISILWLLKIANGLFHMTLNKKLEPDASIYTLVLILLLAVDAFIIRPVAVYMQRILSDAYPPSPLQSRTDYDSLNFLQKMCRIAFYVEGILEAFIGATYFIFPELFFYLYGYPTSDSDAITLWCLSQFGVLLMGFGIYQISCEIDQNKSMMAWWLVLNSLWLYVFWEGTGSRLGPWNPFALKGASVWCHVAFHLVMSLAVTRWLCLMTSFVKPAKSKATVPTSAKKAVNKKD